MQHKLKEFQSLTARISELEQALTVAKSQLRVMETEMLHTLTDLGINRAITPYGTVEKYVKSVPTVLEWSKFYDYMIDTKSLFLLERRPAVKACIAEIAANKFLPGVQIIELSKLKYTNR